MRSLPRNCLLRLFALIWILISTACVLGVPAVNEVPTASVPQALSATPSAPTAIPSTSTSEPTLTPQPLTGALQVAFVLNGNIHSWQGSGASRQLTSGGDARQVWISPDGIHALFSASADGQVETLSLVGTDGSQPAVQIASLLDLPGMDNVVIDSTRVWHGVWTPDSRIFIFSILLGSEGFFSPSGDLFGYYPATGEITELLSDQQVESFALSPDGRKVAIGTPQSVFLYFLEDGEQRKLYEFIPRITYAGAQFVPQPFWGPESANILFALAPYDFFKDPDTEFYQISVDGSYGGVVAKAETGAPLMTHASFAPVGHLVAYTRQVDGGSQQAVQVLSLTDNLDVFYTIADVRDIQWCPDSGRLAFQDGSNGYTLIDYDGSLALLPDQEMTSMRWVDNDRYLYVRAADTGPLLILASPDGTGMLEVATGDPGTGIRYDFTIGN